MLDRYPQVYVIPFLINDERGDLMQQIDRSGGRDDHGRRLRDERIGDHPTPQRHLFRQCADLLPVGHDIEVPGLRIGGGRGQAGGFQDQVKLFPLDRPIRVPAYAITLPDNFKYLAIRHNLLRARYI